MSTDRTRETMTAYIEALVSRKAFARYLADDVVVTVMGTDQQVSGRASAERLITYMHQEAFDARIEFKNAVYDDGKAAAEAVFDATHTGEFAGIPPTGRRVRLSYSIVYDLADDRITALRLYFPMTDLVQQLGAASVERDAATGASAQAPRS